MTAQRNLDLDSALAEAERRFVQAHPSSGKRHENARKVMPGGNTRTVIYYPPFPVTIARGEGCWVWDLEGVRYADFVCEFTAGLYGHSDPNVVAGIQEALANGIVLGAPNRYEAELARLLVERFPALELVRFTNSGTEANLMALSVARVFTGRDEIMVMKGGYHGGVFMFSGNGSPLNAPFPFVLAEYNDLEGTRKLIRAHAAKLACVILEPMLGGGGCIPADVEFLKMLREETRAAGSLLIFDEVMTSRLSPSGLHGALGIVPDLISLGKYLGGGLSFGGFGGAARIMERFDPMRPDALAHAGTFNNNVLTMAAGVAGLTKVLTAETSLAFNARGDRLRARMSKAIEQRGLSCCVTGRGSMLNVHFVRGPVRRPSDSAEANKGWVKLLQLEMLARGYYMTNRGMLALSLPMTDEVTGGFATAFEGFLDDYAALLK
ncbi:MAG: aminotransferase class III-fold pyridoxal phosphate-dependent enzyme [Alphaproteobacteria bacterium]|nr:aminotransferase class III-fold pyridoxal phosphate-dependent enzyme [Alphaproteobacteria bacterium]